MTTQRSKDRYRKMKAARPGYFAEYARKARLKLPDWYVRRVIKRDGIPRNEITQDHILERRAQLIAFAQKKLRQIQLKSCCECLAKIGFGAASIARISNVSVQFALKITSAIRPELKRGSRPPPPPKSILPLSVRRKMSDAKRLERDISMMTDRYIKKILNHEGRLSTKDFPPELVELKRQELTLKRELKNGTSHTY